LLEWELARTVLTLRFQRIC